MDGPRVSKAYSGTMGDPKNESTQDGQGIMDLYVYHDIKWFWKCSFFKIGVLTEEVLSIL